MRGLIEKGDDLALAKMQPYALADNWGQERRDVLEHHLMATRSGLLEMEWDVLCPSCRGTPMTGKSLSDISSEVHCETCNMDFKVNFERSVELSFHPNPSIRESQKAEFCIAGPQTTPHVVVQQLLPIGAERTVTPVLENGRYRLRTLSLRGGEYVRVASNGIERHHPACQQNRWLAGRRSGHQRFAHPSLQKQHRRGTVIHPRTFGMERPRRNRRRSHRLTDVPRPLCQ